MVSQLNEKEILKRVYSETDNASGKLMVDIGSAGVTLDASDVQIGAVEIKDSTSENRLLINSDGSINVNGGGGSGGSTPTNPLIEFAFVEKASDSGNTYIGKQKIDGTYLIQRWNSSAGQMRFATISNNSGQTTYADAWTNRTSLTYDYVEVAL